MSEPTCNVKEEVLSDSEAEEFSEDPVWYRQMHVPAAGQCQCADIKEEQLELKCEAEEVKVELGTEALVVADEEGRELMLEAKDMKLEPGTEAPLVLKEVDNGQSALRNWSQGNPNFLTFSAPQPQPHPEGAELPRGSSVTRAEAQALLKRYHCNVCGKHFPDFTRRMTHYRIHTEPRPYQCEECGKCFRKAAVLRGHQLTSRLARTGQRTYRCSVCCKTFSRSSCLRQHLRTHLEQQ